MILEIRLKNFFSIKDEVVLDLRAATIQTATAKSLSDNYFTYGKEKVLKTMAIYGANASGKSNLIKAIRFCSRMIFESDIHNENTIFNFQPFKLDKSSARQPSEFFIRFVLNDIEHEYSFALTNREIIRENLYYYPKGRRSKVFTRDEHASKDKAGKYSFSNVIKKPMDVAINTSNKTLFISRASQMDRELPKDIFNFFSNKFLLSYVGLTPDYTLSLFDGNKEMILSAMQIADSDIVNIEMTKEVVPVKRLKATFGSDDSTSSVEDEMQEVLRINTYHRNNPSVPFDFDREESDGTRKLFYVILRLLDVIKEDKILLIDEIDTHMHTDIIEFIINLFHASNQSQFIFTTHNTNLIDLKKMRKDQLNFINKKEDGSSELYSLYDFKDFRDTMDAEKGYLQGRFEAVPYIDDSISTLKELING